jgi:hypothetical protein
MKSGPRLFGKTLRDDEVLTRFIRTLLKRWLPAANGEPEAEDRQSGSPTVPGEQRKGSKRP